MTENSAVPPKPSQRDLAREARRLHRSRQLEATEPRVIPFRALASPDRNIGPGTDPKEAA